MGSNSGRVLAALALGLAAAPTPARAEGSLGVGAELDVSQALREVTEIRVDVLDFRVETFEWTGKGRVDVFDPAGTMVGRFTSGSTITPAMNGAYRIDLLEDQYDSDAGGNIIRSTIVGWDVTLSVSGTPRPGRVWSLAWAFNTGAFDQTAATDASFYAKVPGGDDESFSVMELRTDGLAGFIFEIQGNSTGVRGPNAGRSVPETGNSAANEYAIYLNPPDDASYTFLAPTVSDFRFRGGLETSGGVDTCDEFVAGTTMGEFSFTTNVDGSYHIICDVNRDGMFDIVDDGDFLILGHATMGVNTAEFDGLDRNGNPFALGDHQCLVRVTVGEFHYVGRDIETSFLGLRMFQVRRDASRTALQMFWNDALVQMNEVPMPSPHRFLSAESSGPTGLNSGDPTDPVAIPLGETVIRVGANSRAWGDFVSVGGAGSGKGNEAYLDTYTWLDEALSTTIVIHSVDGALDTDGEGLTDYVERCTTATNFEDPDTDADSVNDFVETMMGMPGVDTDGDTDVNARDPNDDDDCVLTIAEDPNGDGDPTTDDTDDDGADDYLDVDDDGDMLLTCDEDANANDDPTDDDSDGDGIPDYLEEDADDDCSLRPMVPTITCLDFEDDCPWDQEVVNGYMDTDGCPEPDRDGDGIPDDVDNCPDVPNTDQMDLDRDMIGDACDPDQDGDCLADMCEGVPDDGMCPADCEDLCTCDDVCDGATAPVGRTCASTDPRDPDTDHGGVPDGREVARGSNPLDPIDDPLPGSITGGGVFYCGATGTRGDPPWVMLGMILFALVVRRVRRRKSTR